MIATLVFPIIASALVFLTGRRDAARDPRLTVTLLVLLAVFPMMVAVMPKLALVPAAAAAQVGKGLPWGMILTGVWCVGFTLAMARLGIALAKLHGWKKRSVEVTRVDGVEVRVLDGLQGPVAAGVLHPVVYVPDTWFEWSGDYRRVVLAHELAHHRRRDPFWRLLAQFTCAVHWFNPLVHWMTHRFIMQCEYACDTIVLGDGIAAKTYASVLCDFAAQDSPSLLAPAMAEACPLEHRVRRMLAPQRALSGKSLALLALLGVLTACSLSMIGGSKPVEPSIPAGEVQLRLTANPFPGEP